MTLHEVVITYVQKDEIVQLACAAQEMEARLAIVRGESIVDPVQPGNNQATIHLTGIHILANFGTCIWGKHR